MSNPAPPANGFSAFVAKVVAYLNGHKAVAAALAAFVAGQLVAAVLHV